MAKKIVLDDITEEQFSKARGLIAEAKGRAVMLVHPFYADELEKSYGETVSRIVEKSKFPVIILQESARIVELKKHLNMGKVALVLPTGTGDGSLLLKTLRGFEKADVSGKELIKLLKKKLGVTQVFLGGMFAYQSSRHGVDRHERKWLNKRGDRPNERRERQSGRYNWSSNPHTNGCAGAIYTILAKSGKFGKIRWIPRAMRNETSILKHKSPYAHPNPEPAKRWRRK